MTLTRNYGTNNPEAWEKTCFNGTDHDWEENYVLRGLKYYICRSCKSTTAVDSGD